MGSKLNVLLLAALAGVALISALALYSKYQRMLEDRRAALQNMVQVAVGVLNYHDRLVRDGSLPWPVRRRRRAAPSVKPLRYADKSILYLRHAPAHGAAPDQTRTRRPGHQPDPRPGRRKALFIAMRDGEQPGHGFVEYQWPQPPRARQCQAGLCPGLCPMGLGGGHGLYLDDLNAEFRCDAMMFVGKIVGLSLLLARWWC